MLFVRRPYHLSEEEADRWMLSQAQPLARAAKVGRAELSRLQSPAARGGSDWDWLVEMHCDHLEGADAAARSDAVRDLVADLRLLGMRPSLVVVDTTRPIEG